MPRAKRPLADADGNVKLPPSANARKARKTEQSPAADINNAQEVQVVTRFLRALLFMTADFAIRLISNR